MKLQVARGVWGHAPPPPPHRTVWNIEAQKCHSQHFPAADVTYILAFMCVHLFRDLVSINFTFVVLLFSF